MFNLSVFVNTTESEHIHKVNDAETSIDLFVHAVSCDNVTHAHIMDNHTGELYATYDNGDLWLHESVREMIAFMLLCAIMDEVWGE